MTNEDLLWAGMALRGGIGGEQRATCGAVASSAVCLGLRHTSPMTEDDKALKERDAASAEAGELVRDFIAKFGDTCCRELVGFDFADKAAFERAKEAGVLARCDEFIKFVIQRLYELEERRDQDEKTSS